ncbi:hypothetical protein [Candidatus Lucifugimonas marina]|uniref:hypothetical protein n=1 Tax=Candidatus Lucifugimonas marina TaxID=3038979 RepID=UPI00319D9C07
MGFSIKVESRVIRIVRGEQISVIVLSQLAGIGGIVREREGYQPADWAVTTPELNRGLHSDPGTDSSSHRPGVLTRRY